MEQPPLARPRTSEALDERLDTGRLARTVGEQACALGSFPRSQELPPVRCD